MTGLRRRAIQRAGVALLLLATLTGPLALSVHHHDAGTPAPSRDSCAVCAATVHAPAIVAPVAPLLVLAEVGTVSAVLLAPPPRTTRSRAQAPRGPPLLLPTLIA